MTDIHLNEEESKTLDETLDSSLSRLHDEIMHTDAYEYRAFLKERKKLLLRIREQLH